MIPEEKRIKTKKMLKEVLSYEMKMYGVKKHFNNPFAEKAVLWKHNKLLRKAEYCINSRKKIRSIWYRMRLYKYQNKYAIHIPPNTFEMGLKLMHVGPVLVNGNSCCGKDVTMHINTGLVGQGRNSGSPTLCDGVVVGIGSVVLGGVTIAENIAIGANSVVNKSFEEPNIAIAGAPAKKISNNGRLSWNKD
ncbi:MAG: serine acetyltransferase [Clostridia bacterium]|nr:serine acetyltransferase [Clostridia bacterium]